MRKFLVLVSLLLFAAIYLAGSLTVWENLSISLFVFFFLDFLNSLGKRIVILDLTIIMGFLTCLVMPVVFYYFYTKDNPLARLWIKYMPISSDDYFSFAVPAMLALAVGLKIPLGRFTVNKHPEVYIENVKRYLMDHSQLGLILIAVGVISGTLDFLAPAGLREVFNLLAHLTFVGVFYVIYSPGKNKRLVVPGVILLMMGQSIATGMFGEFVFILACSLILILLGKHYPMPRKLGIAIVGLFLVVLIQSIKGEYRKRSWTQGGGDAGYFVELLAQRVSSPTSFLDPSNLFVTSVRMNQGWLVAMTMKMVPQKHPFGEGEPLLEAVAAAFVPRFLWPDKPEAGGKANLKRFWGFNLVGWSTNIGPLGEAYANFDRFGGIIYMFFYGLFFNMGLSVILKLSERRPTLVLWLPFLFFTAIAVETDLLSTMGALIKSSMFTLIVFWLFRKAWNLRL